MPAVGYIPRTFVAFERDLLGPVPCTHWGRGVRLSSDNGFGLASRVVPFAGGKVDDQKQAMGRRTPVFELPLLVYRGGVVTIG